MKERPILFKGEMVRAILDGRKTQTRRIVKLPHHRDTEGFQCFYGVKWDMLRYDGLRLQTFNCPYGQIGDRLWVREKWNCFVFSQDGDLCWPTKEIPKVDPRIDAYRNHFETHYAATTDEGPWRPSIHMPRWASRITLEITDIRVERLNDISEKDAKSEGAKAATVLIDDVPCALYDEGFARLWESINGKGSWTDNPWVWVVEFKRIEQEAG